MLGEWIRPNKIGTGLGLLLLFGASADAQQVLFDEPLSPRIANYEIDVQLLPESRTLKGKQVLTWYNKTGEPINELQFHLYLNAFRNSRSTFMIESAGAMRGKKIGEEGWGFIEVDRIRISRSSGEDQDLKGLFPINAAAPGDITEAMEFIQPDDGNEHDKTVFRLPLPMPLEPGKAISLDFEYTALLPTPPFARTGAKEEYFFVGQWFPKIGVYEGGQWNCHQFHANSEFFADFGVYDVRITLPKEFIVGATGLEVDLSEHTDGTVTHYYRAEDVHDFAWTASPEFLVFNGEASDVAIRALVQPDHAGQGQRHVEAAKVAVEYFQDRYGDYPYPNLTVVDPRRGAGGSGGMEYPTLITAGTFYRMPAGVRLLELTIIHEFGHNFWYHLLASNEFEESWLDEGINTYTESRTLADTYGAEANFIDFMGLKLNAVELHRGVYMNIPKTDPVVKKAWENYDMLSYAVNSYFKPGLILETLRNDLGPETMLEAMRAYVERWRFKHPKTQDFIDVVQEVSGQDLSWYFDQALYTNAVLDYAVTSVSSTEIESEDSKLYRSEVKLRRLGEFTFPVQLEIVFEDGETLREDWDGRELWKKFTYVRAAKLASATVDPDRQIPLDVSYANNSRTVNKQTLGVNKVTMRWLFLWQCVMNLLSL